MENVLNKLSDIEATAAKIMEDVSWQKKEMAREMDAKNAAFNAKIDARTAKQLEEIRCNLESEKESQLTNLRQKTDQLVEKMERFYNEHHNEEAKKLYDKLVRM